LQERCDGTHEGNLWGNEAVVNLMWDNVVFSVADLDNSGTISALEQMIVQFVAMDMMDHVATAEEFQVVSNIAAQVLGRDPSNQEVEIMVHQIRSSLDLQGTGSVQREEILEALGGVTGKDNFPAGHPVVLKSP
jgi:predicted RecB family endonuclease